ncbi:MAG: hypothetical protein QW757_00575 [Candidatus Woesearchaeota archaeon]
MYNLFRYKKNFFNFLIFIFITFIFTILFSYNVNSAVIGVSPSIARFPKMIKGGYAQLDVTVTTSTDFPLTARIKKEGEIAEWLKLNPENESFEFSKSKPYTFTLIIEPPKDTPSGNYSGILKITTDTYATVESGAGSSVMAQVGLLIYVEVIGEEIILCRAGAISAESSEINQPFLVSAIIYNDGNVKLRPEIKVDVYDQYKTKIVYSASVLGDQILPTTSKQITKEIKNNLPIGQYFADIYVKECNTQKFVTFDIVEKGQIADSGKLIGIRTNDIGYENEILPIAPLFQNTGSRKVIAKFKGEIKNLKTGKIEQVLETEEIEVPSQETIEFKLFFLPKETGQYQISGRVLYNNKITFEEQSKQVRILKKDKKISGFIIFILYIIIGSIILILIKKLKKKRNIN